MSDSSDLTSSAGQGTTAALERADDISGPGRPPTEGRKALLEFVRLCFAHKRETLLNNLARVYPRPRVEAELAALRLPSTIRPEQLAVEQFEKLLEVLR